MPRRIAILQPLLLALVITLGAGIVWAVALRWMINTADDVLGPKRQYEFMSLRMDGTPVVRTYAGKYAEYSGEHRSHTLDGKSLSISRQEAWLDPAHLLGAKTQEDQGADRPWNNDEWKSRRIAGYNDGGRPPTYWYFVRDLAPSGVGYFAGFDSVTKECIGYIGRNGVQAAMPSSAECFAVSNHVSAQSCLASSYYSQRDTEPWYYPYSHGVGAIPGCLVYVLADNGVVEANLLRRTVRTFFPETEVLSAGILELGMPSPMTTDSPAYLSQLKQYLAARTADRVLILDSRGGREASFRIPAEYRKTAFQFYLLNPKSAVLRISTESFGGLWWRTDEPGHLVWIDNDGKISRQKDYSLHQWGSYEQPTLFSPWRTTLCDPTPLGITAVSTMLQPWLYVWSHKDPTYPRGLLRSWSEFWPPLATLCLLAVLMAWLCYRRQARYGLPWTKTWVVFVFLCGLPGLVAYYVHRRWPALKPCPNCGRSAPCDRSACFACGQEFPAPPPKGIEVFA